MIRIKLEGDWDLDPEKLIRETMRKQKERIQQKVSSTYCSEHQQYAKVTEVPSSTDGFKFQIEACCDDLLERATNAANS